MTHAVMRQLHEDHDNFHRLLALMERELHAPADRETLRNIMHYMVNYADRFHHPLEDLVFDRLMEKDRTISAVILQLEREHAAIPQAGRKLLAMFSDDPAYDDLDWGETELLARDYIARMAAHKEQEEKAVFPLAKVVLDKRDFDVIQEKAKWLEDPLFGKATAAGYRAILERLTAGVGPPP